MAGNGGIIDNRRSSISTGRRRNSTTTITTTIATITIRTIITVSNPVEQAPMAAAVEGVA